MRRPMFLLSSLLLLSACSPKPIEHLKTAAYAGGQQQEGKIAYAENPPLGGAYGPLWQRCGTYTAPLYDEYAVHSLERGAFWLTYSPELGAADLARLKALLAEPRPRADQTRTVPQSLLSPRAGLPSPVVLTAWNAQVQATAADDPRLAAFLDQYSQHPTAPEAGAGCQGGYTSTQ